VDCGSYQAAAKEMNKSHSAIVYSIGCFERQTGLTLLNRLEYRTTLTAAGERVYHQCRTLLSEATQLEQLCSDLSEGWEPSVRLVYDGVLSPEPFLQIFKYFKDEQIPTLLDIYSDYLYGVEKSFTELEAQFMISILPAKQSGLQSLELNPISNILVAHRDHELFKQKQPWSLHELKAFNFFTVRGADKSLNLGTKELEENSTFHLSEFSLKKVAILQGAGFGWLPQYLIQDELDLEIIKPIQWEGSSFQELHPRLYYKKKNKIGRASQIILGKLR
jgi:DNA-binding transcriptional LysR family regulator